MVNKCVIVGCKSGYLGNEGISSFRFPFGKPVLLEKWAQFVNRANWKPSTNSVVCAKHFEKKFLSSGKRTKYSHSTTQTSTAASIPTRSIRRFCQKRQN